MVWETRQRLRFPRPNPSTGAWKFTAAAPGHIQLRSREVMRGSDARQSLWAYWSCHAATLKAKPRCALVFPFVKPKTSSPSLPGGNTTPHAVSLTFSLPYAGNSRPAVMGSAQGAQDTTESGAVRTRGRGNTYTAPPGHHRRSSHIWLGPRLPWPVKQNSA